MDDSLRMMRYSMFLNDTTPKMAVASRRTKYGVNKKSSLFRKNYDLMTAPKVNEIRRLEVDSLYTEDEGDFMVADFVDQDSVGVDSVSAAPILAAVDKKEEVRYKYKYDLENDYNQDQEYYNKYYGELFIDTRPLPSERVEPVEPDIAADSLGTEEKKGLFRRKKQEEVPESDEPEVDQETLDNVTETSEEAPVEEEVPTTED
ncbi:hypothetical protein [Reichenbachiella sp. MSK19-1]|uniref:hypothetical protein n=1 Tax=Reichenbachiella sp. MSK19-1 TaxID=1897631 RepID=UPI0011C3C1C7|nr:hypothetical protein [Reichenbachiella sp. MSK19-1]